MSSSDQSGSEGTGNKKVTGKISRRAMLRGTATAMPAVLSLQSGAALARSSNLIRTSSEPTTDARGRTLCLDTDSVTPVSGFSTVYDAGHRKVKVLAISERDYRALPDENARQVSAAEACRTGEPVYHLDETDSWLTQWVSGEGSSSDGSLEPVYEPNWQRMRVTRNGGAYISVSSIASMSGDVIVKVI